MKRSLVLSALFLLSTAWIAVNGQGMKASPSASASKMIDGLKIEINYHQPGVKGRKIWGGLVPYGQVWRTGANNATTFEVNQDVTLNGNKLPAGKYALFTIPGENEWTVILNSDNAQWGAFNYDAGKDVLTFKVTPETGSEMVERMTFDITDSGKVNFSWENLKFSFDVKG